MEYCVAEIEIIYNHCSFLVSPPSKHIVQESPHPYQDDSYLSGYVSIPGISIYKLLQDFCERIHLLLHIIKIIILVKTFSKYVPSYN